MNELKYKQMGEPVNAKSLLAFTFKLMGQLADGEIDNATAIAQSKLISQANNIMKNELMRTAIQLKMLEQRTGIEASEVRIREIESKSFEH